MLSLITPRYRCVHLVKCINEWINRKSFFHYEVRIIFSKMKVHTQQLVVTRIFGGLNYMAGISTIREGKAIYRAAGYIFKKLLRVYQFFGSIMDINTRQVVMIVAMRTNSHQR